MALYGKFIVNDADYSPLTIYGIGTFMAFSGKDAYRNASGCGMIPNAGPIPAGKYWIVDRPTGGSMWHVKTFAYDAWNRIAHSVPTPSRDWFGLYRDDGLIDDYTWINGVRRGNFRLHPGANSLGCITLKHHSDFAVIRNALLRTSGIKLKGNIKSYGVIDVISNGDCGVSNAEGI
ncbi:DUF2778 domain-containing protein [Serratia rubidaea]|uniref:DUF2778 domain-containing protein n=1 Tax=Serratia rubidaea TaxID=61652 RepID=A0ABS0MJ01_SERRU|nr:DUF2778 domain-containing protein [Serratia rubidaea]MBH1932341.1 DUF2778 domain-containing protein [Serratia rubidaea]MDC6119389.1 DUF2778 domain-containing protein [Serratia rubidaea]MEB7584725.1 DUF2778 domain-containing protein [Serratia rubidaea]